jgi:hypothetical protein
MNRREFIRTQLNKILDELPFKRLKNLNIQKANYPFSFVDLGSDTPQGNYENGSSMENWQTDFILQIYFKIDEDLLSKGKLSEVSDAYIDLLHLAFSNAEIENVTQNDKYSIILKNWKIIEMFGMQSLENEKDGVINLVGTVRSELRWI